MTRLRYLAAGVLAGILIASVGLGKAHRVSTETLKVRVAHMQRVMGGPLPHRPHSVGYWRWWNWEASRRYANPPHKAAWLCIHRYEGSWTDPASPYFGGLQMDLSFQRAYGSWLLRRKGTADHWSPLEQMWVAERAHRAGRGFWPWPNTARYCGLL